MAEEIMTLFPEEEPEPKTAKTWFSLSANTFNSNYYIPITNTNATTWTWGNVTWT